METVILLDMDEVLVDFVGAALQVHGVKRSDFESQQQPGVWDITIPLGMTDDEFWEPINRAGSKFWRDIEPTPWFDSMITLVEKAVGHSWYIVTSPSCNRSACCLGKYLWVEQYLGRAFDRMIPTKYKHLLARRNAILIDDREDTVTDFSAAGGGKGIIFPTNHNSLYQYKHDPVCYVREQLRSIHFTV